MRKNSLMPAFRPAPRLYAERSHYRPMPSADPLEDRAYAAIPLAPAERLARKLHGRVLRPQPVHTAPGGAPTRHDRSEQPSAIAPGLSVRSAPSLPSFL